MMQGDWYYNKIISIFNLLSISVSLTLMISSFIISSGWGPRLLGCEQVFF